MISPALLFLLSITLVLFGSFVHPYAVLTFNYLMAEDDKHFSFSFCNFIL